MLQTVASMRSVKRKYKRKYKVNKEPEWFKVRAHYKKRGRTVIYVKSHWRTRRTWKW